LKESSKHLVILRLTGPVTRTLKLFSTMPSLTVLSLGHNNLTAPSAFDVGFNQLSCENVTSCSGAYYETSFKTLYLLDLSFNQLNGQTLPRTLPPTLLSLDVSSNRFTSFPSPSSSYSDFALISLRASSNPTLRGDLSKPSALDSVIKYEFFDVSVRCFDWL
jgi:hypothetical protein